MDPRIADANFLLRLITKAPEAHYQKAREEALALEAAGGVIEVHPMHVAEALYVLEGRIYQLSPEQAARTLLTLLESRPFKPREAPALMNALRRYPPSGLDFPDVFLAELALAEGKIPLTFDKKLKAYLASRVRHST
jgi:predicted nucleic acid-binding protein